MQLLWYKVLRVAMTVCQGWILLAGAREVAPAGDEADEKTPERSQKSKGRMVDIMQQSPTVAQAQRTSPGPLPYTSP